MNDHPERFHDTNWMLKLKHNYVFARMMLSEMRFVAFLVVVIRSLISFAACSCYFVILLVSYSALGWYFCSLCGRVQVRCFWNNQKVGNRIKWITECDSIAIAVNFFISFHFVWMCAEYWVKQAGGSRLATYIHGVKTRILIQPPKHFFVLLCCEFFFSFMVLFFRCVFRFPSFNDF